MKTNRSMLPPLFFAIAATGFCCAHGQDAAPPVPAPDGDITVKDSTEEVLSTATGTVFSLEADAITLTTEKSAIPLVFETNSATALVDEEEKEVARDLVRKGIAATVHYTTLGKKLLATKVTFTREDLTGDKPADAAAAEHRRAVVAEAKVFKAEAARAKALAAEGNGTLMGFEQILTVRTPGDAMVTQYTINNSTLYVDSAGNPVPPHAVRTGAGLHVQFVEDAGRKIATRVTIQTMPAWVREGLIAAERGTTETPGSTAPPNDPTRTTNAAGGTSTVTDLADAFIYPPIASLAANPNILPRNARPMPPYDSANPPANNQGNVNQPNATPPANNNQPGTTPSNITPPANNNNPPGTTPPNNNRTTPGTTQPGGKSTPSTPSQPSTPPAAPGAR